MSQEHKPNMRCEHCGYEWYSYAHAKNRYYIPFCLKCYKNTVVPLNTGVVYSAVQEIARPSKKIISSLKKYCADSNSALDRFKERYSFEFKIVSDVLLFAAGIIIIFTMMFYFFVVWAPA